MSSISDAFTESVVKRGKISSVREVRNPIRIH